jgi:hypothetical protein
MRRVADKVLRSALEVLNMMVLTCDAAAAALRTCQKRLRASSSPFPLMSPVPSFLHIATCPSDG